MENREGNPGEAERGAAYLRGKRSILNALVELGLMATGQADKAYQREAKAVAHSQEMLGVH